MPSEEISAVLKTAYAQTQAIYQQQAGWWHARRSRALYERNWLSAFTQDLPEGGNVLDLGCGSGVPIAAFLREAGFSITGIDYAPAMIEIAQNNHPESTWHVGDMRKLGPLPPFDGIISWDAFFHLSVSEQRKILPDLARRVRTGGALLLTVGTGEGEVTGTINGETVYHASLNSEEYRAKLTSYGFRNIQFVTNDTVCLGRSVLLATGMSRKET